MKIIIISGLINIETTQSDPLKNNFHEFLCSLDNAVYFDSYKIGVKGAAEDFITEEKLQQIKNITLTKESPMNS